jgi:hypothetical protein
MIWPKASESLWDNNASKSESLSRDWFSIDADEAISRLCLLIDDFLARQSMFANTPL